MSPADFTRTALRSRRFGARVLLAALLLTTLSRCVDRSTEFSGSGSPTLLTLHLRGLLPPEFESFAGNLTVEKVRLALVRQSGDTIVRATQPLPPDSSAARFDLSVALTSQTESMIAVLEYQTASGVTLFRGQVTIQVHAGTSPPTAPGIPLVYTGPGGNIASLFIAPLDDTVAAGDSSLYQITASDSSQQPVPSFYVSWTTSDPRVTINALGLVRTPDITQVIDVRAQTPNGTFAQTTLTILGSAALGLSPDSVEKLPGGQQQFTISVGGFRGGYTWSVNGVDGGNATFGTVDTSGFYVAPAAVPSPSSFLVCARVTATPTQQGCAKVVITSVPSAGADVIVINDQNIFDPSPMRPDSFPDNGRLVRNLVNFQGSGPRNSGRVIYYDRGRNSPCLADNECGDVQKARFDSIISAQGFQIVKFDTLATFSNIPANVKVIVLWMPLVSYVKNEINAFKTFAAQGGRIIFIGERLGFYTQAGIDIENQFLTDMGAQLTNIGADWDCGYTTIPAASIRPHQVTSGVTKIRMACASEMVLGPNDAPLFFDTSNTHLLAGVAKIDFTPLPGPRQMRMIRGAPTPGISGRN